MATVQKKQRRSERYGRLPKLSDPREPDDGADLSPRRPADTSPRRAADKSPRRAADASPRRAADASPRRASDLPPRKVSDSKRPADTLPKRPADALPKRPADTLPKRPADIFPKRAARGPRGDARGTTKPRDNVKENDEIFRKKDLPPVRPPRKGRPRVRSMVEMGDKSPPPDDDRTALTATKNAKICYFYKDDDYTFPPVKMVIHEKKHRKLETVTRDLTTKMKSLPFGVRSIFTPRAGHRIYNLDDLTQDGHYVCSSNRKFARGIDVGRVQRRHVWHQTRPESGRRVLNQLLHEIELHSAKTRKGRPGYDLSNVYARQAPKKICVMKNGEPDVKHTVLMNRRTAQTYQQVLTDLSDLFSFAVRKIYTIEGQLVDGLQTILNGPDCLVAAGLEKFINLSMDYSPQHRTRTRMSTSMSGQVNIHSRITSRRERLANTKGRWRVSIRTNTLPSAGTQSQVTVTVYGNKGNSGPITLGQGDSQHFQSGNIDEFDILVGNVGEIYKIRLAHDNSGDFPGWLCDEVQMRDIDTMEELNFSCRRWLARDEDDQEITRELAVKRPGDSILPLIKYQVDVMTGDVWGGGTNANVYITLYGDRGDTGVRQLYAETKGVYFKQGQSDSFEVEAVSLGHLKRIIVGHDGTGPGAGWYLDKVVIREPPIRPGQEYVFHCGKWLDEGEDDGKIVRELRVQDEYMDDIIEKRNWEWEKWKYERDCQVVLYSVLTGRAVRLTKDAAVDGMGDDSDRNGVFTVVPKKAMRPMFVSATRPNHYLAIDSGRVSGLGKGGPYCEFRVRVQPDRTCLLESVKNPLQFVAIGADGMPGEARSVLDKDPAKRFYVYAKGCFRHNGIIMLCTSTLQCINVDRRDKTLTGRGKRGGIASQFRVHKVSTGGVRMFESLADPGSYMRLKDGKIDCMGLKDEDSHFLVLRHKDKGYVTLQSAGQRGLFVGMTQDGKVHTTIDTGVRNIWLYPEVVEWGVPSSRDRQQIEEEPVLRDLTPVSSVRSPTPKPEPQYADGDWSIHVQTVSALDDADVALVAYGDIGNSGPIVLGAPAGKTIFQDGNEDEFRANLLQIGTMFKIRLELVPKSSTRDPSWKVKDVRMVDLNTKETLMFSINRWLSREEDDFDIMRECAVVRAGEPTLPLLNYVVTVHTGKEIGAETDAQIYLTMHGERGDWGKRYLTKSNNNRKYRTGQVDVFHVEAVSLGNLQRCVVGHDNTQAGDGWYLEQITVKESESAMDEFVFPCKRWLDSGLEDRRIERILMVKESGASPEPPKVSRGLYKIRVITNKDSKPANGGNAYIVVYGEDGKSEEIKLGSTSDSDNAFEPGSVDEFQISVGELGALYKIRIGREDSDRWEGWHLGQVKMLDEDTEVEHVFTYNRWLSRDMDDGDMVRETPITYGDQDTLKVYHYQVQVYTGDHWAAGTDANMYITINGSRGDSGRRLLHKCINNRMKFRRAQVDTFEFEAVFLEELQTVQVSHDGRGHGAGIFLDKVTVTEKDGDRPHIQYVFPCGRWLDDHEDDCLTERTLRMIDEINAKKPPPHREGHKKSNGRFLVRIKTSDMANASTSARAYLTLYGTSDHSDKLPLLLQGDVSTVFNEDSETEFMVEPGDIGKLMKIRLEHDSTSSNPDWRVDYVQLQDMDTQEVHMFYLDRWLAVDRDNGLICREMPLVRKAAMNLPVLRYVVCVTTGSQRDAGADKGTISINLFGVNGDTGMQELAGSISKNRLPWQPGQEDIYIIEAVSVGKLKKIEVTFADSDDEKWYLQQVRVAEGTTALSQSVVYCHEWIPSTDGQILEFPVAELQPATGLIDALDSIPPGLHKTIRTKGRWMIWVQTGLQENAGTTANVNIVLCGLKGESIPIGVNAKDGLNPASVIKLEAKTADIGLLFKVRVYFPDKNDGASWFLAKMKLKDQDTGEELHFEHNDWVESSNENPEGAMELPVIRPDLHPLKEQIYIVSVTTGTLPRSETDASLYCNLIGQWGSSGERSLAISDNKTMFLAGQVDAFTVTCIELGRVEKVMIGHDTVGRGQGWYCAAVNVKVADETETIFSCNRWLDSGCDNRKLTAELLPLSRLPIDYVAPARYVDTTDFMWSISVVTAGQDKLPIDSWPSGTTGAGEVSIVVYGTTAVKGPIDLPNDHTDLLLHGKTDHYTNNDLGNIGEIVKIRMSSGYEGATDNVWTIREVCLENQQCGDVLRFDFGVWLGEMGGDIRKELPLVVPGMAEPKVLKYYIEVHTSDTEMTAGTDSHIFITLYGSQHDSGRRHLSRSRNSERFQTGAIDKFDLEAVDLGNLEKLVVAKGPGKPWLLEKIVVKESEFAPEENVFMFEGWIGSKHREIEEIEETLKVTATIPSNVAVDIREAPELETSRGRWTIEATTGGRRGPEEVFDVNIVFCGQQGESRPMLLQSNRDNPFQIGLTDVFNVSYSNNLGELTKVRLAFVEKYDYRAWYIRKIKFKDTDTNDMFWAELNDWLAVDNAQDGVKEFPVPWPAIQVPSVLHYVVSLHVGMVNADQQGRDVYMYMFGEQGNTGKRLLKHSVSNTVKLQENQIDVFEVEAVHLGDLIKIVVGHTNNKTGCGWFLDRASVRESPDAPEVMFECDRWLDSGEDDGQTERTLYPSAMTARSPSYNNNNNNAADEEIIVPLVNVPLLSASPRPATPDRDPTPMNEDTEEPTVEEPTFEETIVDKELSETGFKRSPPPPDGNKWIITTVTGRDQGEGTSSQVVVTLYGDKGQSEPLVIGGDPEFKFNMSVTDTFNVTIPEDIGELYKARVGFDFNPEDLSWYDDFSQAPTWFLEKLEITNADDGNVYEFEGDTWVKLSAHQDFWCELPVIGQPSEREVRQYQVTVFTDKESRAGTANVFLQIFGAFGDTGYRKLMASRTNTNKFQSGSRDVFHIGAVDLGKLTKIKIKHDGTGPGSGWLLDRVVIETEDTTIKYVFRYNRWLDEGDGEHWLEQELMLSEVLDANDGDGDKSAKDEELPGFPWRVVTVTSEDQTEGLACPLELVLYGDKGQSEPILIGEDGFIFNAGATDSFDVRVLEEVGDLYKVRLGFHGDGQEKDWFQDITQAPTWCLDQMRLTNGGTDSDYVPKVPVTLQMTPLQDFWRELPIINRDKSLPVYEYQVEFYTGQDSGSGTDVNVGVQLYGERGDTGLRRLMASKSSDLIFQPGHRDVFEVSAVDLGSLTKVKVSNAGSTFNSGWYLDRIVVTEMPDANTRYVFNVEDWLDEGDGETNIEVTLALTDVETVEVTQPRTDVDEISPTPDIQPIVTTESLQLQVCNYIVQTFTSDGFDSGTDSNVHVTLIGTQGDSGKRYLTHNLEGTAENFVSGHVDSFSVEAMDLGRLVQIQVGHDGKGPGSGWYLDKVTVMESVDAEEIYVFKCEQWLHDEKDDCLTERMLPLTCMEKADTQDLPLPQQQQDHKGASGPDGRSRGIVETPTDGHDTTDTPPRVDSATDTPPRVNSATDTPPRVDSATDTPPRVDSATDTPSRVNSAHSFNEFEGNMDDTDNAREKEKFEAELAERGTIEDESSNQEVTSKSPEIADAHDTQDLNRSNEEEDINNGDVEMAQSPVPDSQQTPDPDERRDSNLEPEVSEKDDVNDSELMHTKDDDNNGDLDKTQSPVQDFVTPDINDEQMDGNVDEEATEKDDVTDSEAMQQKDEQDGDVEKPAAAKREGSTTYRVERNDE